MAYVFAVLLLLHGLIHLFGVAKAFGWAELPQLTQPIAPAMGVGWLVAAALFVGAAITLLLWPRGWWVFGFAAVLVSTVVIIPSWTDAKFGLLANLIVGAVVVCAFLWHGPGGLEAAYESDVAAGLARDVPAPTVTEADLSSLPEPVRHYLRAVGVVGNPRVWNMRTRMRGRIRGGASDPWMPLEAEQYNFFDQPSRFFYLTASRAGVPIQGYHRYAGADATMTIKAVGAVTVQQMAGAEMTRAETVTLFNDMCVLAPATLISPAIAWEAVDDRTVRATFSNAGHVIRAELRFNVAGELVDFWSEDRGQTSPGSATMAHTAWSTPIGAYRSFGPFRLMSRGEARWHDASGAYAYIELEIDGIEYNVR